MTVRIAIVGDRDDRETHVATDAALRHAADDLDLALEAVWHGTGALAADPGGDGVLIAPGSPYRDPERVLDAIRHAREHDVPALGTCAGFQHMVLEYARNVLGFAGAHSAEYDPGGDAPLFIDALECSLAGRTLRLTFAPGSVVEGIYGADSAEERYYCNFGVSPQFAERLADGPLRVTGRDPEGDVRVVELPGHPFYVGTLYVPQASSSAGAPHPLVRAFLAAATAR